MLFEDLKKRDGLRRIRLGRHEVSLHEDHRWVLALVAEAQQQGVLPCPTPVVLLDRHTDCAEPKRPLPHDTSVPGVLRLCDQHLSPHDDDWIVAGIEIGLLADVFLFGVDDRMGDLPRAVGPHGVFGRWEMPGDLGEIGVNARRLLEGQGPILLDIDLDCFAYPYRGAVWPWTEAMFRKHFLPRPPLWNSLLERAQLITICREAGCCGGSAHADSILELCREFLFQ
ncbi:MAG: hypothetical protein ACK5TN_08040 [Acidobacteriota bacterium]